MAITDLSKQVTTVVVPATSVATAAPTGGTDGIVTGTGRQGFHTVRTLIAYQGTVESAVIRIWFRDPVTNVWYEGATTDDLDALTPGGASPVNESRDWVVGYGSQVFFQVTSVQGGGTVAVRVQGVA